MLILLRQFSYFAVSEIIVVIKIIANDKGLRFRLHSVYSSSDREEQYEKITSSDKHDKGLTFRFKLLFFLIVNHGDPVQP